MLEQSVTHAEAHGRPGRLRFKLSTLLLAVALVSLTCGYLYWRKTRHGVEAESLVHVSARSVSLFDEGDRRIDPQEFEIFRNEQVHLAKSKWLIQAVLRDPKIASLPLLTGRGDPVAWLFGQLQVDFRKGDEILSVRLRAARKHSGDASQIVDAVVVAYIDRQNELKNERGMVEREILAREQLRLEGMLVRSLRQVDDLKSQEKVDRGAVKFAELELEAVTDAWREMKKKTARKQADLQSPARVYRLQPAMVSNY